MKRQMSVKEYRDHFRKKAHTKYGSQKTLYKGDWYDSALEANYAATLELWKKAGEVIDIQRQVRFKIKQDIDTYVMDFVITFKDGKKVAIDVKGFSTPKNKSDIRWWKLYGEMELWLVYKSSKTVIVSKLMKLIAAKRED